MFERRSVTRKVVQHMPPLTRKAIELLPRNFVQTSLSIWLNKIFKAAVARGELQFVEQRKVCICVTDLALDFSVSLKKSRLCVALFPSDAEVKLSANTGDLLMMITGRVDPDTLFFRRRLMISGDTELGLELKNFFDRLDAKSLLPGYFYSALNQLAEEFSAQQKEARAGVA